MKGIHDLGGKHGFGAVRVEADEPVFHAPWERRVLGMAYQVLGFGWANGDAFRHAIERIEPVRYLTLGYYGRWLEAVETLLIERGVLAPGEVAARLAGQPTWSGVTSQQPAKSASGFERELARAPQFCVGDRVLTKVAAPAGHTRLPDYAAGRCGVVHASRPACVYPDSHAHGRGEDPQHVYNVRFEASELWGRDSEPGVAVYLDLFEPYLARA